MSALPKSTPHKKSKACGPHQIDMFKKASKSYGGTLLNTRKGRSHGRPLSTLQSMHLVLRSSLAKNDRSFKNPRNAREIQKIIAKFSSKYGVKVLSLANVGTHLHFHIKLGHRLSYYKFIRAITSAIAMHVSGRNRWTVEAAASEIASSQTASTEKSKMLPPQKFWDYRPFTRIISGLRDFLTVHDYVQINQLEGLGVPRSQARWLIAKKHPLIC